MLSKIDTYSNIDKKIIIWTFAPLTISLFVYLFYRSESTVVNFLAQDLFGQYYYNLRCTISSNIDLSNWFIYNLPEALWVFCTTLVSYNFKIGIGKLKLKLSYFPLLFAIYLEFAQYIGLTNGTFDILDIVYSGLACIIALKLAQFNENTREFKTIVGNRILILAYYAIVYLAHVND